jgi:hypothetical protein
MPPSGKGNTPAGFRRPCELVSLDGDKASNQWSPFHIRYLPFPLTFTGISRDATDSPDGDETLGAIDVSSGRASAGVAEVAPSRPFFMNGANSSSGKGTRYSRIRPLLQSSSALDSGR